MTDKQGPRLWVERVSRAAMNEIRKDSIIPWDRAHVGYGQNPPVDITISFPRDDDMAPAFLQELRLAALRHRITKVWVGRYAYVVGASSIRSLGAGQHGETVLETTMSTSTYHDRNVKKINEASITAFKYATTGRPTDGKIRRRDETDRMVLNTTPDTFKIIKEVRAKYDDVKFWARPGDHDRAAAIMREIVGVPPPRNSFGSKNIDSIDIHLMIQRITNEIFAELLSMEMYLWLSSRLNLPPLRAAIRSSGAGLFGASINLLTDIMMIEAAMKIAKTPHRLGNLLVELTAISGELRINRSDQDFFSFCGRADSIKLNDKRNLHSEDGPAVTYYPNSDGSHRPPLYARKGVVIPNKYMDCYRPLTASDIDGEPNAEIRRVLIDIVGRAEYIRQKKLTPIDVSKDWGSLYTVTTAAYLHLINETPEPDGSRKEFWFRVPTTFTTAKAAFAWHAQVTEDMLDLMSQRA